MRIKAFAKINLGIEVLGKRPDGYHDILTLFQSIDLADVLEMEELAGGGIGQSPVGAPERFSVIRQL